MKRRFLLCLSAVLAAPANAAASPLFELAGGTMGQGGFNARGAGPGAASAYFNPALLPDSSQEFDLGFLVLSDQISMTLDGRPSGNVPLVVGERTALDPNTHAPIPNDTVPTQWLQRGCSVTSCGTSAFAPRPRQAQGSSGVTRTYTTIGLVSKIMDPVLVLGVHAIVPNASFTQMSSFYNDEREQLFSNSLHPELYSDRLTATSLAFGAGSRLSKRLSVGLSFTLSLTNDAAAATYVRDPVDYSKLLLDNKVGVTTAVAPHLGVTYTPVDRLRLSGTFHSEQKLVIRTGITATLPGGTESHADITAVHDFVPWTAALAGSLDLNPRAKHAVGLAWTVAYEAWSRYLDRHGERPGDVYGPAAAWKDVVTGSVGVRYAHARTRSYLDFSVHPSPVPLQTGRSNYVDNDRAGVALGSDYDVKLGGYHLRPGLGLQAQHLFSRYQAKNDAAIRDEFPDGSVDKNLTPLPGSQGLQTNNPGWPGFASDGWILGANVWVSLVY
jgi:long-chain fatty acid transport protein